MTLFHSSSSIELAEHRRNLLIAILALLAAGGIGEALSVAATLRAGANPISVANLTPFFLIAGGLAALWLRRRGRDTWAAVLLTAGLVAAMILAVPLVAGIGVALGIAGALSILVGAFTSLPSRPAGRLTWVGIIAGVAVILLDLYWPGPRVSSGLDQQMPVVTAGFLLVFAVIIYRQFKFFTLRAKLILLLLAVSLAPVGLLSYISYQSSRAALVTNTNQSLLSAASQTALTVDTFITTNLDAIRTDAQLPELVSYLNLPVKARAGSPEEAQIFSILQALNRKDTINISSYAVIDQTGLDVIDTQPGDIGVNNANRDYVKGPLSAGLPYVSPVEISPVTNDEFLYFSAPIRDINRQIIGVLRVRYDGTVLQQLITRNTGAVGAGSFATLLDENTIRLAHGGDPALALKAVAPLNADTVSRLRAADRLPAQADGQMWTNLPAFAQALSRVDQQPFFSGELLSAGESQRSDQAAMVRLTNQPWTVVYSVPQAVAVAPVEAQSRLNVLVALGLALAVAAVAVGAAQVVAAPINRLTAAAEKVRSGDLQATAAVDSRDEIGVLADTFNQMTGQLRDTLSGLEQRVADRTRALALSAEISRRLSTILNQRQLVSEVVEQLRDAFNFYHVHIYLFDRRNENLIMVGGTGEAAQIMLNRGHQIPRGRGLVGRAADTNLPVLAPDVTTDPNWLANPLLPETRSELAAPIAIGDRVLGVLDVQQSAAGALKPEDADLIQSIANQVAVALQNTRSYVEAQRQAEHEALINAISQKIQSTDSVESALQVTAREIGRALNVERTRIKLGAAGSGHKTA